MSGRLEGIARHDRPRGPIETLDHVAVTRELGVRGDLRGAIRPGKSGRRQISLIETESWQAALAELGTAVERTLPWHIRRANLLVQGIRLPREPGKIVAIGQSLRIEVTCECDPCSRMDEIHPGLKLALMPDWRGGVLGRVLTDGEIAIGDEVRIEE
ncbi:MOSC domain-containing protein [Novosphingobium sp. ERN07]|uniref:MOSC domain-containing protein n=1 Tax=Novosphingobium sp. ERN07 TaxID=2726187 RepID=UPI001456C169|nr:MOSC domain-containing protein [Novosphingobium sp. ERN07]NLR70047.1 MOSC domain-containing protein [Novosphingobium sp. ERN07]